MVIEECSDFLKGSSVGKKRQVASTIIVGFHEIVSVERIVSEPESILV